jgi:hypothetical protein
MRKTLNSKAKFKPAKLHWNKIHYFGRKKDGKMKGIATSKKMLQKDRPTFFCWLYIVETKI